MDMLNVVVGLDGRLQASGDPERVGPLSRHDAVVRATARPGVVGAVFQHPLLIAPGLYGSWLDTKVYMLILGQAQPRARLGDAAAPVLAAAEEERLAYRRMADAADERRERLERALWAQELALRRVERCWTRGGEPRGSDERWLRLSAAYHVASDVVTSIRSNLTPARDAEH